MTGLCPHGYASPPSCPDCRVTAPAVPDDQQHRQRSESPSPTWAGDCQMCGRPPRLHYQVNSLVHPDQRHPFQQRRHDPRSDRP